MHTYPTLESTSDKITRKIDRITRALNIVGTLADELRAVVPRAGKKHAETMAMIDSIRVSLVLDQLSSLNTEYRLTTVRAYWTPAEDRAAEFHRAIASDNIIARFNDLALTARARAQVIIDVLGRSIVSRAEAKPLAARAAEALAHAEAALALDVPLAPERDDYERCTCGQRMLVIPELSELHCTCGNIKSMIGTVFRDEYCPQEGQKIKHGGYEPAKHYRLWIERLQALENKTFDPDVLARIEYVLTRDRYDRRALTCEKMRAILKDTKVNETHLNDHAPLLVKRFGGPTPPVLSFHEHQLLFARFCRLMALYDIVRPGPGNKRYYPYFIFKLIERIFRDDPVKLRLLDSIHLQSRDTVIKNDNIYRQVCALADPGDDLVYKPTDPARI